MNNTVVTLIVSTNECRQLVKCLESITFCSEKVVVANNCSDDTVKFAEQAGAKVISKGETVPLVETIHADVIPTLAFEWVFVIDPDERLDATLNAQLTGFLESVPKDIGVIRLPIQFYFKGRPLSGTPWGSNNTKRSVYRIKGISLLSAVHSGFRLNKGFNTFTVNRTGTNVVHHDWLPSYKEFIRKHLRYLKYEGQSRYDRGRRATLRSVLSMAPKQMWHSFVLKEGYRDYFMGFTLSLLWAWYQTAAEWQLWRYQRRMLTTSE